MNIFKIAITTITLLTSSGLYASGEGFVDEADYSFYDVKSTSITGIDFCAPSYGWISCDEQSKLSRKFEGLALTFGNIAAISGACPEPFLTKGTALLVAAGGVLSTTAKFYIDGLDCEEDKVLSNDEKRTTALMICFSLGKDYIQELGEYGGCSE